MTKNEIVVLSYSAREARDRSPMNLQLSESEELDTSYFCTILYVAPTALNAMHVKMYFEETAASKKSIDVYTDEIYTSIDFLINRD